MIKPIVIGNWKLNGDKKLIKNFFIPLNQFLIQYYRTCTVIIAPPLAYAALIQKMFSKNTKKFFIGAQNVDVHTLGSFTGEVSTWMLKDIGIKYVIIGHSERRYYHEENNQIIAKKFYMLKKENLIPILCIGETEKEKKENKIQEKCKNQIDEIFHICQSNQAFNNSIIAYEPIWAIGSGHSASEQEIQHIANFIRNYINYKSNNTTKNFFIQYGGSVTHYNVKKIINQKDVDGLLVGGASLRIQEFTKIIEMINI